MKDFEFCVYVDFYDGKKIDICRRKENVWFTVDAKSLKEALFLLYKKCVDVYGGKEPYDFRSDKEMLIVGVSFYFCDSKQGDWYYYCCVCQNDDDLRERFWC